MLTPQEFFKVNLLEYCKFLDLILGWMITQISRPYPTHIKTKKTFKKVIMALRHVVWEE